MQRIQSQGVHHLTFIGADRQTSIDFWEGLLGMPFIFEKPNLDVPEQNHLHFDPGEGRLITVFTNENYQTDPTHNPEGVGNLHHIAFQVSRATFTQDKKRLDERGIGKTGKVDRGFMFSIYSRDPLGQLIELPCHKFEPPTGVTHSEVLLEAHKIRVAWDAYNINDEHLADAIENLTQQTARSLSADRTANDPYDAADDALDKHVDHDLALEPS